MLESSLSCGRRLFVFRKIDIPKIRKIMFYCRLVPFVVSSLIGVAIRAEKPASILCQTWYSALDSVVNVPLKADRKCSNRKVIMGGSSCCKTVV